MEMWEKMPNKPLNTWNSEGMGYEWREKSPLAGAERYLWNKFQEFPQMGDWRKPGVAAAYRAARSPLHAWYEEGWEFLHSLQDHLFSSSSVLSSSDDPPWCNFTCEWPGCSEPSQALVNQKRTDRNGASGDFIWEWLPDAPRFYCYPHYHEHISGEKYVPPTEEERRLSRAQMKAQSALMDYDVGKVKDTSENVHFTIMDGNYLSRMVKLIDFFMENPDGTPPLSMITDDLRQ